MFSPLIALIRRTVARITVLSVVLVVLMALFQAALVAVAASLAESGGFERLAGLAPAFIQEGLGPALTSFAGMAALGFFEPLIVMIAVQFAIHVATEPAGDVESRLVDLMLARSLPRHALITRSFVVMTGAAILLPATLALGMWASLALFAPDGARWPEPGVVLLLMTNLAAVAWCLGAAALAAGAWFSRRGSAQALVGVGSVAFYLMEVVGEAWTRAEWLSWLSPFHRFHGAAILAGESGTAADISTLVAAGVIFTVLAYWKFARRDV